MRIALVVHKFPPTSVGGTEVYTLNLAREMSRRGHNVFVFCRDDRHEVSRRGGIAWEQYESFVVCRVSRSFDAKSATPLVQFLDTFLNPDVEQAFMYFLREVNPEIIHFQHLMSLSYRLIMQAKRKGLPVILTLHDYWFLCANSQLIWPDGQVCRGKAFGLNCARCAIARIRVPFIQLLRPVIAPLLQIRDHLVRRAAMEAHLLIAPSRFLIQQYVQAGFPSDRFIHLENGIDVERIQRYPWRPSSDGRIRFTYLGALAWQKGVHIVVEAFRGLPADKAILRIYGDPNVFPDYAARLRRLADPANTVFEGPVPNEEVGWVLAETDFVVVPSLWYENSPVVIQEAFAAGVPVIASDLGALPEKVQHGVNGWLCPPGRPEAWREVLLMLIEQIETREKLRHGISSIIHLQGHVDLLEEIYINMTQKYFNYS